MGQLTYMSKTRYFLVFSTHNLPKGGWYQNFLKWCFDRLKKGFSHVAVIEQISPDCFMRIEGCSDRLSIIPIFDRNFLSNLKSIKDLTIIEVVPKSTGACFHGIITCVSIAKYLLGIKKLTVITPYQLYKFVRKESLNGKQEF